MTVKFACAACGVNWAGARVDGIGEAIETEKPPSTFFCSRCGQFSIFDCGAEALRLPSIQEDAALRRDGICRDGIERYEAAREKANIERRRRGKADIPAFRPKGGLKHAG